MKEIVAIAKALSDENRVKALLLLCKREVCVCQIVDFLKLAPSTVSKHMSILKAAGLVESRKEERWMYYRHAQKGVSAVVDEALSWLSKNLNCDINKKECCGIQIPRSILEKKCITKKN